MPNEVTPSELLALAQECMPTYESMNGQTIKREWIIEEDNESVYDMSPAGIQHDFDGYESSVCFDPISNPAHAWAVETWLFDDADFEKPYDMVIKEGIAPRVIYRITWLADGDEVFCQSDDFPDNLSAAIAVLRKRGGK
jgi:hypothetical protein